MKLIPLTQGYFAKVSDCDFEWLSQWKWMVLKQPGKNTCYAVRTGWDKEKKRGYPIRMHREILSLTDPKVFGEHADGDGLNNQRGNLRESTCSQNAFNSRMTKRNTSGKRGISWSKAAQKWHAYIDANKKRIHLGLYNSIEDASTARDKKAVELHGAFAQFNSKQ